MLLTIHVGLSRKHEVSPMKRPTLFPHGSGWVLHAPPPPLPNAPAFLHPQTYPHRSQLKLSQVL